MDEQDEPQIIFDASMSSGRAEDGRRSRTTAQRPREDVSWSNAARERVVRGGPRNGSARNYDGLERWSHLIPVRRAPGESDEDHGHER